MKHFSDFLLESMGTERVQHELSIPALKAFTRNMPHGQVRYVIDPRGKIHAGDANRYVHGELTRDRSLTGTICGYIQYKNKKFTHHAAYKETESSSKFRFKHPLLDKMKKAGITSTKSRLSFEW